MVKLYFISVLYKNDQGANILYSASDLSSFGYFQKSRFDPQNDFALPPSNRILF